MRSGTARARRTSILLLSPSAHAGGAERAFASLASLLPRYGVQPEVVLLEHGPLETWLRAQGCRYAVAPEQSRASRADAVAWAARMAERAGVALVLSNKSQGHVVGGAAAKTNGVPAVWWQQDIACGIDYELLAAATPAAAVVCSSDYAVAAQRGLTPSADIRKIHLGVPVAAIAARRGAGAGPRAALRCDGRPLLGIVGRLEAWKGQDVFLRAAERVASQHPDATFAVVGGRTPGKEETYADDLRALARELGIADRVHFEDHALDVFPWFDAFDVCVHATNGEPFGLVLVEAMALGTPLVATALGGPVEIVEPGLSGLLVPPGDDRALADATSAVLSDEQLAARLAVEGRRRAFAFTDERMAAAFADLFRELVAAR
jgi:glycosyltransferase involved in cell wall biosynthesis